MSEAFTPGPWCVESPMGDGPGDSLWIVTEVEGGKVYNWRCIALVSDDTDPTSDQPPIYVRQRDANARLIAASPAMAEALERIANHYDMDGYEGDAWKQLALEMAEVARAALPQKDRDEEGGV